MFVYEGGGVPGEIVRVVERTAKATVERTVERIAKRTVKKIEFSNCFCNERVVIAISLLYSTIGQPIHYFP
jgi:hypothetical protein